MKKAIFSIFIIAVLSLALSIFASADSKVAEKNMDENGEIVADFLGEYTIDGSKFDVASIDVTYKTTDGEEKTGKIYFTTNIWNVGNRRQVNTTYLPSGFDMEQTVYMFDKVDVDGDGAYSGSEYLKGTQGDKNLYYTYESFENGTFDGLVNVKTDLKRVVYSTYLEYFGGNAFSRVSLVSCTHTGTPAVDGVCYISPRVTSLMSGTFGGEGNGSSNWYEPQFTRFVFEERTGEVEFGQYAICRGVLTEIVFLSGTYKLGRNDIIAFQWQKGTSTPSLQNIVIADGAKINSGSISWNVGSYGVIYLGSEESYQAQLANGDFSALTNKTDSLIFEELCYVWGHTPTPDDYNCTTAQGCIYLKDGCQHVFSEAMTHTIDTVYTYANGFNKEGIKKIGCTNGTCTHGEVTEISALFTSKGYSRDENTSAIVFDYKVNKDAIAEYEEYLGTKISYGVVASRALEIYEGSPINSSASAKDGAVSVSFENNEYSLIQLKLTSITAKDDALYCCGYFIINGEVSYLNGNEISSSALAVSYNSYTVI